MRATRSSPSSACRRRKTRIRRLPRIRSGSASFAVVRCIVELGSRRISSECTRSMDSNVTELSFSVELEPGQKLSLPQSVVDSISPGRWQVSICSLADDAEQGCIRDHSAFLHGYAPEDEG